MGWSCWPRRVRPNFDDLNLMVVTCSAGICCLGSGRFPNKAAQEPHMEPATHANTLFYTDEEAPNFGTMENDVVRPLQHFCFYMVVIGLVDLIYLLAPIFSSRF
jgi:hypothetical protein